MPKVFLLRGLLFYYSLIILFNLLFYWLGYAAFIPQNHSTQSNRSNYRLLINSRRAVSLVQKEARIRKVVAKKTVIKKIVRKRVISAAGKAVIKERSKAKVTRGEALNRPVRNYIITTKARPDNSK